jgi:hypothetical protein
LSLKRAWFLANQIVFNKLMIAAVTVILHWGDQDKSLSFHISSKEENCILWLKQPASQHQSLKANGQ